MATYPSADESFARLHAAGWSVGDVRIVTAEGTAAWLSAARAPRRVMHWWGASKFTVWNWRKALGVVRADNPGGSRRLIRAVSEAGAAATRGPELPPEQVERRRRNALGLDLGRHLRTGYHGGPRWMKAQLALLGTAPDGQVASRIGRTETAVRVMRNRLGIPRASVPVELSPSGGN